MHQYYFFLGKKIIFSYSMSDFVVISVKITFFFSREYAKNLINPLKHQLFHKIGISYI